MIEKPTLSQVGFFIVRIMTKVILMNEHIKFYIKIFSLILATLSTISLIQQGVSIGILGITDLFLSFYRNLVSEFLGFPLSIFNINIHPSLIDLWCLSFIGAGAYVRVEGIEKARFFDARPNFTSVKHWKIFRTSYAFSNVKSINSLKLLSRLSTRFDDFSD